MNKFIAYAFEHDFSPNSYIRLKCGKCDKTYTLILDLLPRYHNREGEV